MLLARTACAQKLSFFLFFLIYCTSHKNRGMQLSWLSGSLGPCFDKFKEICVHGIVVPILRIFGGLGPKKCAAKQTELACIFRYTFLV